MKESQENMFHMAWFLSYTVQGWMDPWGRSHYFNWLDPDYYVSSAKSLERAGFDFMMFEDGSFIADAYHGSSDWSLAHAQTAPKHDPLTLISSIGQETKSIGLVATMTTTFYPPFLAARLLTTLDHLTDGRVGANLVTAHNDRTAQNFGLDKHYEHDLRYVMADEWVNAVEALWATWDSDALTMDVASGYLGDPSKVRYANFQGSWYRTRGPLNLPPGPQRRPVLCQAGGSAAGRVFGGTHADTIIGQATSVEGAKEYRSRVREAAVDAGRNPDDVKVLFLASITLGDTDENARDAVARSSRSVEETIDSNLALLSFSSGIDFSTFDLDGPVPKVITNAAQHTTATILSGGPEQTLRDVVSIPRTGAMDFVGSPDTVAGEMAAFIEEVGGDGFAVQAQALPFYVTQIADGLAPELRRRGLIRDGYDYPTLRENLLAF
ncbi:MAG: NtaA/DmoA family FMN-dependent monooxygenase [Gordonia sp. (in: high G+C Gram-positive bacteria)]